ncbi:hypothetical protein WR25_14272 [Diploscapter pachys]|uniref:RxLR effector protein n=1 Tax=Diploscapter pachys TaxID=2018661 RepID=A0A2A2LVK6_9BILA|nr:hypothetical protein WR25_14272 [Diploscapter pachys]
MHRITALALLGVVGYVAAQQAFQAISLAAVAKVIPHATNANVFDLTTKLNAKKDKVADQKKIVNNFYSSGKFGKPKPNQKVLSPYDNKDYSKKKLLALVDQRVALKTCWSKLMPILKNKYGDATADKHKQLFSVLDIEFLNSIDSSINMYLLAAYYKEYAKNGEAKADDLLNKIIDVLNNQLNNSPALAWILYDLSWEKQYNAVSYLKIINLRVEVNSG